MADPVFVVFCDANVLVKTMTRTLVLRCGVSGYMPVWSALAEQQADRHRSSRSTAVRDLRERLGMELSPTGSNPERFTVTAASDRQILADAEAAKALFLITEDVDDFGIPDLLAAGVTAVNPDLFLSVRSTAAVYVRALNRMVARMSNPPRTQAELHSRIARQHPRLAGRYASLFNVELSKTVHREPAVMFRGTTCLNCLKLFPEDDLVDGLCPVCASCEN